MNRSDAGRRTEIRPAVAGDAQQICAIYNHYVVTTVVSFEEQPVAAEEMARRIAEVGAHYPWLVWDEDETICGYAYATRWKERAAYRFSVETTIYLAPDRQRRGIGAALYDALLTELRSRGVHCAFGGIALPNDASVALHEKLGFKKIAHLEQVGWKLGRWVDVGYWQLLLDTEYPLLSRV
jgi:phosphinothricin acetyltransferase